MAYSVKEVIEDLKDELTKHLEEIKTDVKDLNQKVAFQNGRVTKLEEWSKEAKVAIESSVNGVSQYKVDKARLLTLISVLTLLGTGVIGVSIWGIETKIQNGIIDALSVYDIEVR